LAPPYERPSMWAGRATASNLDTLLDRGVGRRVRMLLSFQRPSHRSRKGFLPTGAPGIRDGSRGGPTIIASDAWPWEGRETAAC
jgi:hypothetical protein